MRTKNEIRRLSIYEAPDEEDPFTVPENVMEVAVSQTYWNTLAFVANVFKLLSSLTWYLESDNSSFSMVLGCFILLDRKLAEMQSPFCCEETIAIARDKLNRRFKIIRHKAMYMAFLFDPIWLSIFPAENIESITFAGWNVAAACREFLAELCLTRHDVLRQAYIEVVNYIGKDVTT